MTAMKLETFGGEVPKLDIADIKKNQANLARNTNLYSGDIIPYNRNNWEKELSEKTKTVFPFDNPDGSLEWISFNEHCNIIKSQFDETNQRIFMSTRTNGLKTTDYTKYPTMFKLGCSRPQITPSAHLGAGGIGTALSTLYVYTYVNNFGEESAPSDPSPAVLKKDGQLTLVKIPDQEVPEGYIVKKKRIYRSVATGDVSGYFFLAEVPISQTAYTDVKTNENLNEPLSTLDYKLPKEDLKGLIVLSNGVYVAHTDKEIYFSEPNLPYTYPTKYMLSIPEKIIGLGVIKGNKFAILTDGCPYYCYADTPAKMRLVKTQNKNPCIDFRSIVGGMGCIYAGFDGLFQITDSKSELLTGKTHSKETFRNISAGGFNAVLYGGKYLASCNIGCFIYDSGVITRLRDRPQCSYYDTDSDKLYFVINGHLMEFNSEIEKMSDCEWESKVFRLKDYENFSAFRILADFKKNMSDKESYISSPAEPLGTEALGVMGVAGFSSYKKNIDDGLCIVEFWRDKEFVARRYVMNSYVVRLPHNYKDDKINVKIKSNIRVRELHIGKTPLSLKKV